MKTYLMFDGRHYKIGQSQAPEKRLKELKTANPRVRLLAFGKGISEKALHKMFEKKRISGEWFRLSNNDVCKTIGLLKNQYGGCKYTKEETEKYKKADEQKFNKYESVRVGFGKYQGIKLIDMNTDEELDYIGWCVENLDFYQKGAFRWWLKEHSHANLYYEVNRL